MNQNENSFGTSAIIVQKTISIINDRIILPKETKAQPGEEICAMLDPYQKKIMLMKEEELLNTIHRYMAVVEEARQQRKITYAEYLNYQRYFYGILPLRERTITKKREYQIFSKKEDEVLIMRRLQKLNFKDSVFAIGVDTHLELYPSEKSYKEYQEVYVPRDKTLRKV